MALSTTFPQVPIPASKPDVRVIVVTDANGKQRQLFIPASLDLNRPKRPRTNFTSKQLQVLELEFCQNHFITETRRHALALVLGLSKNQIKVWFQNRRTKFRRQQKKLHHQQEDAWTPRRLLSSSSFPMVAHFHNHAIMKNEDVPTCQSQGFSVAAHGSGRDLILPAFINDHFLS